jgi:hypothetical protein
MQFRVSFAVSLFFISTPAFGFIVPDGTPGGVYSLDLEVSGEDAHAKIEDIPSETIRAIRWYNKREGLDQYDYFNKQLLLKYDDLFDAIGRLSVSANKSVHLPALVYFGSRDSCRLPKPILYLLAICLPIHSRLLLQK